MTTNASHHATHFGFETVDAAHKQAKVNAVFDRVVAHYDIMNDLMSAGVHHAWKDRLIDSLHPTDAMHLLDMAGGTGDVAFRFLKRGGGQVTISDINQDMLNVGRARSIDMNMEAARITWQAANAEALPFADNSFDAYTISFGIRNVTHLDKALEEAYRTLKRGGHFLCLEFSHLPHDWLQKAYDAYSFRVIPAIGEAITKDRKAYQYLVESIRQFPKQEAFAEKIRAAGFDNVTYTNLSQGVVAIHSGWKI
jgi:demethylmenaquinone methyltransferase / 2-methoxy-6-polyprenyl-1,4-benzoquinol methylase